MKKTTPFLLFASMLLLLTCRQEQTARIKITNPVSWERPAAFFTISRKTLGKKFNTLSAETLPKITTKQGKSIPLQLDDLDNDGTWDVLAATVALKAKGSKKLRIRLKPSKEKAHSRDFTNIRFANIEEGVEEISHAERLKTSDNSITQGIFQMEGPAWENEKVAFRNYFDARNGYDIFGKTTQSMVLDKVGLNGQNYHELSDWGMDILKVGASLGAGGTGLIAKDTLIRTGAAGKNTFELISEGPIRSIFDLHYTVELPERKPVKITRRICIRKGEYGYHSRYTLKNQKPQDTLVMGIVNKYDASLMEYRSGKNHHLLATHARQSVNEEYLGMALLLPYEQFAGTGSYSKQHPVFPESHYAKLQIPQNRQLKTFFFAGWEKTNTEFSKKAFFKKQLKRCTALLENPVTLQWK